LSEALYPYYERELVFIRQLAREFGQRYPAEAGRLLLEPDRSGDPHVERLIQAFALLAARIHRKLDDEFPELTDALLAVLYPHYLAPVPSMAILQFDLDPARGQIPNGFVIPAASRLRTRALGELMCRYRTGYPVNLWPVQVAKAQYLLPPFPSGSSPPPKTGAILRLELECFGGLSFSDLRLERLRFFLSGEPQLIATLHTALFNECTLVTFRSGGRADGPAPLKVEPADCLGQVGFETTEGLIPYPESSFLGYRLLTEFFAFPAKFQFVDLMGWERIRREGFGQRLEVLFYFNTGSELLQQGVGVDTFLLGCTPIVNLFDQVAEPIALSEAKYEYQVVPDVTNPDGMEVFAVNAVSSTNLDTGKTMEFHPFYSVRHGGDEGPRRTFWYAARRLSRRDKDRGTDVFLNLVDLDFNPQAPANSTLIVSTTCTNRDLPTRIRKLGERLPFDLEGAAPLARIRCVHTPTPTLRPPSRRGRYWRLISHLSLNHLSITDSTRGREALQEILRLYDFSDPDVEIEEKSLASQLIEGIISINSRRVVGRVGADREAESGFCRGVELTVELDDEKYLGTGAYLFSSVLERFVGLYTSINSFTQLVTRTRQGMGTFKRWPPRAGEHPLL
jgi:type VI secretion system protein ImpG